MKLFTLMIFTLLMSCFNQVAMAIEIRIPKGSIYTHDYKIKLLEFILSKADGEHSITKSEKTYTSYGRKER